MQQNVFQANHSAHQHRCAQGIQTTFHANSAPFAGGSSVLTTAVPHSVAHGVLPSASTTVATDGTLCTTAEHLKLSDLSSSCIASILASPSKQRAETFLIDEVRVLLHEISLRKQILLSLSPSTNRLKRRAWEEVAAVMAARWPHSPRRTAEQVKKKWENLVSKTKRKIRNGHILHESDWSETNSVVMEFLAKHSPWLNISRSSGRYTLPYSTPCQIPNTSYAAADANFSISGPKSTENVAVSFPSPCSCAIDSAAAGSGSMSDGHLTFRRASIAYEEEDVKCGIVSLNSTPEHQMTLTNVVKEHQQSAPSPTAAEERSEGAYCIHQPVQSSGPVNESSSVADTSVVNISSAPCGNVDSSLMTVSCLPPSFMYSPMCDTNRPPVYMEPAAQKQLLQQTAEEHAIRMEILRLQRQAWELQVEMLRNAANGQRSGDTTDGVRSLMHRDDV